jgi:BolA protein
VAITAAAFQGLGRVERQRRVNAALAEELAGPVHALSIKARAPGEA